MSVPLWTIPFILTAVGWFVVFTHPSLKGGGFMDITPLLAAGAAIIATLILWLIYFIVV